MSYNPQIRKTLQFQKSRLDNINYCTYYSCKIYHYLLLLLLVIAPTLTAATYNVGPGQSYPTMNSLPPLNPGDLVQVNSATYSETFRFTRAGTSASPIVIRGVGATRPIFDGTGLNVDGALPNPRAIFQVEASYVTIDNIEFKNAANGNNGAGIRITNTSSTTTLNTIINNCKITYCDMGMMSDSCDNLLIQSCEVAFNGTSLYSGSSHNFYLNGNKTTLKYNYIHDSLYGQNFKTRGHYTELLYNTIANSQDGELGFVDSALTATANSNAVMIGNVVIAKVRGAAWNHGRFIQFGEDVGGTHTGTLYAINNTFYSYDNRMQFVNVNVASASAVMVNNICFGADSIAAGTVRGSNNWMQSTAAIPAGLSGSVLGSDPLFANAGARDFHLTSSSGCIDQGTNAPTCVDGTGATQSGVPNTEYVVDFGSVARTASGTLDIGAYEYHPAGPIAPAITTQPANQTVTAGQTASFNVAASGTAPLTYQWQKNNANIIGATGASYTTPATTTANSGSTFRCVVSNSAGSATSSAATLTVNAAAVAPSITTQPANQTVTAGQTASFSVAASGTAPLTYQWQKGTTNISGATGASYTTPATTTADSGSTFRCVVSNSKGSATSNAAMLTVNAVVNTPPTITSAAYANPNPAQAGQSIAFSVAGSDADGDALSYSWSFSDGGTATGASATHAFTAAGTYTATAKVSDSAGNSVTSSVTVTVNANVTPTIHIAAITMSLSTTSRGKAGVATVTIKNANGATVSGATVTGSWSGLTSASVSGNTSSTGKVKFTSARTKSTGTFTFTVTNVTAPGYTYAASQNAATSGSITTSGVMTLAAPLAAAPAGAALAAPGAVSLGSVKANQTFKLALPRPEDIPASGAVSTTSKNLPKGEGLRVSGGNIGGKATKAGTFTFTVQFQAKTTSVDASGVSTPATIVTEQQYTLMVTQ